MIIEGNVSVKAALLADRRKISRLIVDENKKDRDTRWILHQAEVRSVPVEYRSREEIDRLAEGRTHGGLIAETGYRHMQTKDELTRNKIPFLFLVEGVEDPFNLGYIMRTLYAAGCDGLILRKRNWENAEAVILKSSAGASEYLPVYMSDDPGKTVLWLKEQGIRTYAAMRKDAVSYEEGNYRIPALIAVGGEMRGLSAGVRTAIDQNIYIPYANDFHNALNAAAAAAVLAYEVFRQRRK